MKITSINQNYLQNIPKFADSLPQISSKEIDNNANSNNIKTNELNINFINNLLIDLANNIQSDDNHPLSRLENSPIEYFDEALAELKKTTALIPIDGNNAQNNINANMLIDLLAE